MRQGFTKDSREQNVVAAQKYFQTIEDVAKYFLVIMPQNQLILARKVKTK